MWCEVHMSSCRPTALLWSERGHVNHKVRGARYVLGLQQTAFVWGTADMSEEFAVGLVKSIQVVC
jgi:hypothetical protein